VFLSRSLSEFRRLAGLGLVLLVFLIPGLSLAECLPGQMQEANLAYNSAEQFLSGQQWDQAIARLQSIVQVCPEHVEATRGIGTAYQGKGDWANAQIWYAKVVDLRSDQAEAGDYANLGKAFAKQKQYKEARAEYMKAEMLAPDDCGVLINLGIMHYASGFHPQSVEVLEHALEACGQYRDRILPQLSKSAEAAAKQQRKAGNNDKAAYYDGLMSQYGGAAGGSTTYDMVKQKMAAKDYPAAVNLLEQMLAQNPNQPNAQLTLARALDAAGRKTDSVGAYRDYMALKPTDAKAAAAMIQVMVEAGQCSAALAQAKTFAAEMVGQGNKALAGVHYGWGMALDCQENFEDAKTYFQKSASSGNPRFADAGSRQVSIMDQKIAKREYDKKKAAQGG